MNAIYLCFMALHVSSTAINNINYKPCNSAHKITTLKETENPIFFNYHKAQKLKKKWGKQQELKRELPFWVLRFQRNWHECVIQQGGFRYCCGALSSVWSDTKITSEMKSPRNDRKVRTSLSTSQYCHWAGNLGGLDQFKTICSRLRLMVSPGHLGRCD